MRWILVAFLLTCLAGAARAEATRASCNAAARELLARAAGLPPADLTRRIAEHDLMTALDENDEGDVIACAALVAHAHDSLVGHRYELRPGEALLGSTAP